jgi:K+-sensing histidine kinase KdpD
MTHRGLLAFAHHVHYVDDRATALERAVEAVQSATEAAWVAAYTRDDAGGLTLAAIAGDVPFGFPEVVDQDDPVLVAARAERDAVEGTDESVLAGTLVLPFVCAGRVTGMLAVGPALAPFAPRERETLRAVANSVGLALEVLHVRALRREAAQWRERAQWAERELALLQRVFEAGSGYGAPGCEAAGGSLAGNESATASS